MEHRERSAKWRSRELRALTQAEMLTRPYTAAPIPLSDIARHQRVVEWGFGEYVGRGGLKSIKGGFELLISCDDDQARKVWKKSLDDELDGGRSLPKQVRFTIAHEIAHTFFYNLDAPRPTRSFSWSHWESLGSLERTCNRLAGYLLIPKKLFDPYILCASKVDADLIYTIGHEFRVPLDTVVFRLRTCVPFKEKASAVFIVGERKGLLIVRAVAMDGPMPYLLPNLAYGSPITAIPKKCADFVLASVQRSDNQAMQEDIVPIKLTRGEQRCRITYRPRYGVQSGGLVTITRIGSCVIENCR